MTLTLQDALFSAALAVYLTASVFVAAVRWGHRCQPYGKHMDYYHPAWKTVIFCYLSNLLMAPAVFMVARVLRRQSEENCSNPDDFPHHLLQDPQAAGELILTKKERPPGRSFPLIPC